MGTNITTVKNESSQQITVTLNGNPNFRNKWIDKNSEVKDEYNGYGGSIND